MQNTLKIRLFPVLAALAALLLYVRTLGYNYLWDDIVIFRGVVSTALSTFDLSGLLQPFLEEADYFRPLVVLSFWLDAVLAGNRPGFSHAVNLALFLVNILLVFSICRHLAKTLESPRASWRAFWAALIYAIHPVMVESTVWISGRFDVLATTCILGATRVYLSRRPGHWRLIGFGLLSFLALLSKETGIMLLPGIFCLWLAVETTRHETPVSYANFRQCLAVNNKALNTLLGIAVLYAALRFTFLPVSMDMTSTASAKYGSFFLAMESVKFYFHQALFPFATMFPRHPVESVVSAWSLLDILGNLATLAALVAVIFHAMRRRSAAAWVFLAGMCYLAPALYISISLNENLGHERFLTTPLAFWSMAAVLLRWERIFATSPMQKFAAAMNVLSPRLIAQAVAAVWLSMLAWTTHTTIPLWQDNLILWSWSWKQFPDDKYSRYSYFHAMSSVDSTTAKKAVDHLMQETGFLYADEAILYAGILMKEGNIKSLDYLDMVRQRTGNSLNIHEDPNAEYLRIKLTPLASGLISSYYYLSAQAYFRFRKNPATAQQLNETAFWYKKRKPKLDRNDMVYYNLPRAAYLYGMGLFGPADKLRDELVTVYGIKKEAVHGVLRHLLEDYCDWKTNENEPADRPLLPVCSQLDQFFPKPDNGNEMNKEGGNDT
jgi:hypothetical protein